MADVGRHKELVSGRKLIECVDSVLVYRDLLIRIASVLKPLLEAWMLSVV